MYKMTTFLHQLHDMGMEHQIGGLFDHVIASAEV